MESSQEKTEDATEKRKEDLKKQGSVVRSKELTTTLILIAGTSSLLIFSQYCASHFFDLFSLWHEDVKDLSLIHVLGVGLKGLLIIIMPIIIVLFLTSFLSPLLIGGWSFSLEALEVKFSRMDPIAGLGKIFSAKSLVELLKSILKFVVLVVFAALVLNYFLDKYISISQIPVEKSVIYTLYLIGIGFLILSLSLITVAIIDVPWQLFSFLEQSKMTKQELKDEVKDSEGKPEVKSKIAELRQKFARRRMMAEIPTADVIITNPTHFACALKYDGKKMQAPILVAKGTDLIAQQIQKIAKENNVPILSYPLLARAVYYTTDFNKSVQPILYKAIAQVLAYVFQLKSFKQGKAKQPVLPIELDIPDEIRSKY
jgi:flagellar biosynthetic protein FlhB